MGLDHQKSSVTSPLREDSRISTRNSLLDQHNNCKENKIFRNRTPKIRLPGKKRWNKKNKYPSNRDLAARRSGRDPDEIRRSVRRKKKQIKG